MEDTSTAVEGATTTTEEATVDITARILEVMVDTVSNHLAMEGMASNLPEMVDTVTNRPEMADLEVTRTATEVEVTTRTTGMEASSRAVEVEGAAAVVVDTVADVETAGTTATETD